MKPVIAQSARHCIAKMPPLFSQRTFWGTVVGAVAAVAICGIVGLISWQLGAYSRALTVVWTFNLETAALRGGFLGFLVGWWSRSPKQMLGALGVGVVAILIADWRYQRSQYVLYENLFDLQVTLHYVLNALLICAATYGILLIYDRGTRCRHSATDKANQDLGPAITGDASSEKVQTGL